MRVSADDNFQTALPVEFSFGEYITKHCRKDFHGNCPTVKVSNPIFK